MVYQPEAHIARTGRPHDQAAAQNLEGASLSLCSEAYEQTAMHLLPKFNFSASNELKGVQQSYAKATEGLPDTRICMNAFAVLNSLGENKNTAGDHALQATLNDPTGGHFTGTRNNRFINQA